MMQPRPPVRNDLQGFPAKLETLESHTAAKMAQIQEDKAHLKTLNDLRRVAEAKLGRLKQKLSSTWKNTAVLKEDIIQLENERALEDSSERDNAILHWDGKTKRLQQHVNTLQRRFQETVALRDETQTEVEQYFKSKPIASTLRAYENKLKNFNFDEKSKAIMIERKGLSRALSRLQMEVAEVDKQIMKENRTRDLRRNYLRESRAKLSYGRQAPRR